jgi:hypothetical protein
VDHCMWDWITIGRQVVYENERENDQVRTAKLNPTLFESNPIRNDLKVNESGISQDFLTRHRSDRVWIDLTRLVRSVNGSDTDE